MYKSSKNRYQIKVALGNGQYRNVYGRTQAEARKNAAAFKAQLAVSEGTVSIKLRDVAAAWLDRQSTLVGYSQYRVLTAMVNNWNRFPCADIDVDKLTVDDLQAVINAYAKMNPRTHQPSSAHTLHYLQQTIQGIMRYAAERRYITYDPAKFIVVPRGAPKKVRTAITDEQKHWIIDILPDGSLMKTFCMIGLYAGLRRGEILALTWNDIYDGSIHVTKAIEYINEMPKIKSTKTKAGQREVPVMPTLQAYLDRIPHKYDIIISTDGSLMKKQTFRDQWDTMFRYIDRKIYGSDMSEHVPRFTTHQLRHTFATDIHAAGVDVITAQHWLGHSDIKTTLQIYTDLTKETQDKDIEKFSRYIENQDNQNERLQ